MQAHMTQLLESWAATSRQWALAGRYRKPDTATKRPPVSAGLPSSMTESAGDRPGNAVEIQTGGAVTGSTPVPDTQLKEDEHERAAPKFIPAARRRSMLARGRSEDPGQS